MGLAPDQDETEIDLTLPRLGETMDEGRITAWLIEPGARFERGEIILEVETDKTVVEVPALQAGRLVEILAPEGDEVAVEAAIARIAVAPGQRLATPAGASEKENSGPRPKKEIRPAPIRSTSPPAQSDVAASPAARDAAKRWGLPLETIQGTGRNGRISAADVAAVAAAPPQSGPRGPFFLHVWEAARATAPSPPPHVVLVHGLFADARGFEALARRLARDGVHVSAIDLPGHGAADNTPMTFNACAAALADLLAEIASATPGRLILLGHSLGGALAVRAAAQTPDLSGGGVEAICLINPIGLGGRFETSFPDAVLAARTPEALGDALEPLGAPALTNEALAALLARIEAARPALAQFIEDIAPDDRSPISVRDDLEALGAAAALGLSWDDRVVPWRLEDTLTTLPASVGVHFLTGGHAPYTTNPLETHSVLRRLI